jgi:choline monooxygenase
MSHTTPFEIDPDIAKASTLPASFYTDPATFERSKRCIFERTWHLVADTDQVKIPGAVFPFTLYEGFLDEPLLLTRDTSDQLHCMSNVCTHRANLVAECPGNERFLRCRYHGRRFGLDGRFQHMPEFEGVEGFPSARDDLAAVPFGTQGKFIWAALDPVASLDEYIAPIQRRIAWWPLDQHALDMTRAKEYMVRAHWALYVDNYLEGFHIPFIHAALNEALEYEEYETECFDYCNLQLGVAKGGEDCFDLPPDSPDYGRRIAAYYFWIFPSTMLNVYPWGISVNIVRPIAPDLTKVSFLPYVYDPSRLSSGAGSMLDRVEREDEFVVESCQKGLRSRFYDRGRFSPRRETGTHHFHRLIARFIQSGDD